MRSVTVAAATGAYDVLIGPGTMSRAAEVLGARGRVAVVTQATVAHEHAAVLERALTTTGADIGVFEIPDGEAAKTLDVVGDLCRRFARSGLLRGDAVVALGGGVVGDTAGFAAAIYHRGVDVLQIPTTLLAQVDSSVGGKTAVNLPEGKNLVGAFHPPVGVLADTDTLATLPTVEYRSGLGEVAKYAFLGDTADVREVGRILDDERTAVVARDPHVLERLVRTCVAVKAEVVAADEQERHGGRAVLNYGHTLAHALEAEDGFTIRHGEAVAIGLVFAAELALALGRIGESARDRHRELVSALGLPTEVPPGAEAGPLVAHMRRDKKASGGLTFVVDGPDGPELLDDPPGEAVARAFAAVGVRATPPVARG
ncbi:MAG: 3-dehydroquinate synthase [Acidimicrobiia bacterium]